MYLAAVGEVHIMWYTMAASSGSKEPSPSEKEGKLICFIKVSNAEITMS